MLAKIQKLILSLAIVFFSVSAFAQDVNITGQLSYKIKMRTGVFQASGQVQYIDNLNYEFATTPLRLALVAHRSSLENAQKVYILAKRNLNALQPRTYYEDVKVSAGEKKSTPLQKGRWFISFILTDSNGGLYDYSTGPKQVRFK